MSMNINFIFQVIVTILKIGIVLGVNLNFKVFWIPIFIQLSVSKTPNEKFFFNILCVPVILNLGVANTFFNDANT